MHASLSGDATVNARGDISLASDSVGTPQIEAPAETAVQLDVNGASNPVRY
jgi:hypothetical protein